VLNDATKCADKHIVNDFCTVKLENKFACHKLTNMRRAEYAIKLSAIRVFELRAADGDGLSFAPLSLC